MRDILFRGKGTDTGEWVTGTPFIFTDRCKMIQAVAVHPDFVDSGNVYCSEGFPVDIETVGQFTGLTDKNGERIFEGDIVRYKTYDGFDCYSVVKFGEYKQDGSDGEYGPRCCIGWYVAVDNFTCPDWAEGDSSFFQHYMEQESLLEVNAECKILGNIHDNPELLKVR